MVTAKFEISSQNKTIGGDYGFQDFFERFFNNLMLAIGFRDALYNISKAVKNMGQRKRSVHKIHIAKGDVGLLL
jgi:hypothetical protein